MKQAEKKALRATAVAELATQAKQAREAMFKARLAVAAEASPSASSTATCAARWRVSRPSSARKPR